MTRLTTKQTLLTFGLCSAIGGVCATSPANAQGTPTPMAASSSSAAEVSKPVTADAPTSATGAPNTEEDVQKPHGMSGSLGEVPGDRIEASPSIPPSTIEVTALDPQSKPLAGAHVELVRERQSIAEGNSSTKWQATTDASGHASFTSVPSGSDSQYRVVAVSDGKRYGTRPFPVTSRVGTKVVFHVYPLVRNLKESLVAGRGFVFVEPRDEVLSIEYMQQFHNLGQNVLDADGLELALPKGWKAFSTNATDPDLTVVKVERGVKLVGVIAPGQHSVAFTFQVPSSNQERVDLDLDLWPNTAEAQVATLARPGLQLTVAGFPNATVTEGNGRMPFLVTGQSFTRDSGPPTMLDIEVAGLPVVGPGRWVAVLSGAALALGAILLALTQGHGKTAAESQSAARARIIEELAALELAHRQGKVGDETFAATREALLSAFVRIERESLTA